ncbi:hypothetical protein JOD24_000593 [Kroppenstedtia sanguinis]
MKKLIASNLLLLSSLLYVFWSLSKNPLYLSEISMEGKNPISFNWLNIQIDTGIIEASSKSIYHISLVPVYLLVVTAIVLILLSLKQIKNK